MRALRIRSYIFGVKLLVEVIKLKFINSNNSTAIESRTQVVNTLSLERILAENGSDKSVMHDYWHTYEKWMRDMRGNNGALFELGLGTNNPEIPSNMGGNFVTGGSLRAWATYFPKFQIFGADIDRDALFQDDRINTCWVDQTKPKSFESIYSMLHDKQLDFIIIDGLHQPYADILSVRKLLPYLKIKGHIFIEDVEESSWIRFIWGVSLKLLPKRFKSEVITHKGGLVVNIQRVG